jgi:hypothetical protein
MERGGATLRQNGFYFVNCARHESSRHEPAFAARMRAVMRAVMN